MLEVCKPGCFNLKGAQVNQAKLELLSSSNFLQARVLTKPLMSLNFCLFVILLFVVVELLLSCYQTKVF